MRQAEHEGNELDEKAQVWVDAELAGDAAALDKLAVEDFVLVGPLGFMLDREQWLDRFRVADLIISSLTWDDSRTRVFADAAVVVGRQNQEASYRGQRNDGQFRVTQVWVSTADTWQLASLHFSPIMAPPGVGSGPGGPQG